MFIESHCQIGSLYQSHQYKFSFFTLPFSVEHGGEELSIWTEWSKVGCKKLCHCAAACLLVDPCSPQSDQEKVAIYPALQTSIRISLLSFQLWSTVHSHWHVSPFSLAGAFIFNPGPVLFHFQSLFVSAIGMSSYILLQCCWISHMEPVSSLANGKKKINPHLAPIGSLCVSPPSDLKTKYFLPQAAG